MTLMISYDLNSPGQNYSGLAEAIKDCATEWIHPLESLWFVTTREDAGLIRDRLGRKVDRGDKLLIMAVTRPWATNFKNTDTDWLSDNVT